MPEIGWAGLGVVPEVDSKFYRQLEKDIDPALTRVGKSSGSRFGSVLGKSAALAAGGAVAAGFAAFKLGKDSVAQASELGESLNAVNVTYGKMAGNVKYLGEQAATSLGLSNAEFNSLAVRFSAFSKQIAGTDGVKSVMVLDDLTHRASDFASVMNLEVNEAAELFQSGLAGETEPLRRFGLDLSAAKVEAFAYAEGIAKAGEKLTEGEKVQARYGLLMEQTAKTQGDFRNTSDSLANQQRILNARWDDARAKLGTALLPILEDATGFLLDEGIPAFEKFSDWFNDEGVDGLKRFGTFTKDEILPVVEDLGGFLKDAAGFAEDAIKFLNDLPDPAKYAGLAALIGGVGAVKLRGGKGGALGGIGSALGLTKPIPVFVTNPGFGGAGGVVPGGGKGGKLGKVARTGAKALPIVGAVAVGYELGGDEFGAGARGAGILGLGSIKDLKEAADEGADYMTSAARRVLADTAAEFERADIPTELKTEIAIYGLPEAKADVRALVREYDLTPPQKQTLFELAGFDRTMDRLKRINAELDWVARPREARINITKAYAQAGYETRGGLQEGGGGPVARDRRRAGGGV